MSIEPFLRDTTQLLILDPIDYDESIRVMVYLISNHPISVPLKKIPNPPISLRLLHTVFERIKIYNNVLETKFTDDIIVSIHKSTFLKVIGVAENPEDFKVEEPMTE